jgi:hypothetical protein
MQEQPTWCGVKNASAMLVYSKEHAFSILFFGHIINLRKMLSVSDSAVTRINSVSNMYKRLLFVPTLLLVSFPSIISNRWHDPIFHGPFLSKLAFEFPLTKEINMPIKVFSKLRCVRLLITQYLTPGDGYQIETNPFRKRRPPRET